MKPVCRLSRIVTLASAALAVLLVPGTAAADEAPDLFVDYIKATTADQYIDTGLVNAQNTDYKADFTFRFDSVVTKTSIIGCTDRRFTYVNSDKYFGGYYNASASGRLLVDDTGAYIVVVTKTKYRQVTDFASGKQTVILYDAASGAQLGSDTGTTASKIATANINTPLYLMNWYDSSTGAAGSSVSSVRLYGCKFYQKTTGESEYALVRDFHPAIKDGKSGLWDDVERREEDVLHAFGRELHRGRRRLNLDGRRYDGEMERGGELGRGADG